jgi:hypothetical protein
MQVSVEMLHVGRLGIIRCGSYMFCVVLDGVMVIVLAIGPNVHRFRPAKNDGFLRAIQISTMTSFGRDVMPSAPCYNFLPHFKDP